MASEPRGPLGLGVGAQQFTGRPAIGSGDLREECKAWSFFERRLRTKLNGCCKTPLIAHLITHRLAAMKMITAIMMVPQMAALAAIVILSMFDVCAAVVRTSRHCE